jgi:diguanylate cyclase (GGDEF)-like protein
MTELKLPPTLVDGLLRLCQGDFSFRLPRTHRRDQEDTIAFFVNSIAEELERILRETRAQEEKLAALVDRLSEALQAVAAGDFSSQVERDFSGDSSDVLAFLVNNTIAELGTRVAEAQRQAAEEKQRLEQLVADRTAELERLATTDALTGALNRRRLFEIAAAELARADRYEQPLCLAMLDLDHFKSINDRYGHAVGDEALRAVTAVVRERLRSVDALGRYGGEELVVVLPQTARDAAQVALERIRAAVAEVRLFTAPEARVYVSGGLVQAKKSESLDEALGRADAALYQAKHGGRNRIVVA